MKFIAKAALVVLFAVVVVAIDGSLGTKVAAHDGDDHSHTVSQTQTQQQPAQTPAVVYNYEAQPGDTYSYMARKAVQTYGIKANVQLSLAQIMYAETNLTQQAGSPELSAGQKVTISEESVKQWVEKAKLLTASEAAAWDYYVQFVDFNTNHVGVAHS